MAVELVLNDLSLPSSVNERGVARELMTKLINVLSTAQRSGVTRTLRTHDDLYNLELSPDYPIASWLNDALVEREERNFFLSKLDIRKPLLADITDSNIQDEEVLSDFCFQGKQARALGIAYLLNALAVSFCSDPKWDCNHLDIEIVRLDEISEDLTTNYTNLIHASRREHVLGHVAEIKARLCSEPWHPQDELLSCYTTASGEKPLTKWLDSFGESLAKDFIQARLNNVKRGTLGDYKSVGEGVQELRIDYGSGYRIYFGQVDINKYLLLYGGDKSTQVNDIKEAKKYWQDYKLQEHSKLDA